MSWGVPQGKPLSVMLIPVVLMTFFLFSGTNFTNDSLECIDYDGQCFAPIDEIINQSSETNESEFVDVGDYLNVTEEQNHTQEEFSPAGEPLNETESKPEPNETLDKIPEEFLNVDEIINSTEESNATADEFVEVENYLNLTEEREVPQLNSSSQQTNQSRGHSPDLREGQISLVSANGFSTNASITLTQSSQERALTASTTSGEGATRFGVPPGEYDLTIIPSAPEPSIKEGSLPVPISRIQLNEVKITSDTIPSLKTEGLSPSATPFGKSTAQAYAIDPSSFEFSEGEITVIAKGTELYKCAEWNYEAQECSGKWRKLLELVPGEEYTLIINSTDPAYAEYAAASGAPRCTTTESPCIANSSLLLSRGTIWFTSEANQPNTIDACTDGNSGWYTIDESVENITIESLTAPTNIFNEGDTVRVNATVYCWDTGAQDNINFVYSSSVASPSWSVVGFTDPCPGNGFQQVSATFTLDDSMGEHVIRVINQYDGDTSSTCGIGNYDDNDDLVFQVNGTPPEVNLISPANSATTNGGIIPFSFNTTDSASCTLLIDGQPDQGNISASADTNYAFNASPLSGAHTWAVQCAAATSEIRNFTQSSDNVILETTFTSGGTFNPDGDNRAPWERGDATQIGGCHLDSSCWGTGLSSNYDASGPYSDYLRLRVAQTMNFTSYQNVVITFYQYRYFENAATVYDGGVIDIRNYTNAWERVTPEGGYSGIVDNWYSNPLADQEAFGHHGSNWELVSINLSDYDDSEAMRFRFYFGADDSVNDRGWFIDDVRVFGEPSNQTTGCFLASTSGATYTLDSNLNGTKSDSARITVLADDVTIDCAGHSITGDHLPNTFAIFAQSVENLKVENCIISNYTYAVLFNSTSHSILENISIENTEHGFHAEADSHYNIFLNNTVHDQVRCAFTIYNSSHNTFEDNIITNTSSAICLYPGSDYNIISNNTLSDNADSGIYLNGSSYNLIEGNIIHSSKYAYNVHYGSDYNNLTNNLAYNTSDTGFEITYSMHNRFESNIARHNALRGFWALYSSYNTFINNTAYENDMAGFSLSVFSNHNTLEQNKAYNNTDVGFRITYNSTHNNLTNNEAYENDLNGIWMYSNSNYNNLEDNQVHDNGHYGVLGNHSAHNSFVNNNIYQNYQYGVYLEGSGYNNFTGGIVYGNDFLGFNFESGSDHNRIISVAANNNIFSSLSIEDSSGTYIDPSYFCNSTIGIDISNSNDTIIDDSVACNNSLYGIYIFNSNNTLINRSKTHNNPIDIVVNNTAGYDLVLNITHLVVDSFNGSLVNHTNISIYDVVPDLIAYSISWAPSRTPPGGYISFEDKLVNITAQNGYPSINRVVWHWSDAELLGYDESQFGLWKYNSSGWALLNNSPDTVGNTLTRYNLAPESDYGILQANITGCQVISSAGSHQLISNATGAPNDVSGVIGISKACIILASDDVDFSCNGYNITNDGTATAAGLVINGSTSFSYTNITIRDCPGISGYLAGVYITNSSNNTLTNLTSYNNSHQGIYIQYSYNTLIEQSNITNNSDFGLAFYLSNYTKVIHNSVVENGNDGISGWYSDYANISYNNVSGNIGDSIFNYVSVGSYYAHNIIDGEADPTLIVHDIYNVTFYLTVDGANSDGFDIPANALGTVFNNTVHNSYLGIRCDECQDMQIDQNDVYNALVLIGSSNMTDSNVTSNTMSTCSASGIYFINAVAGTWVHNNSVTNASHHGLYLNSYRIPGSVNNNFTNNTFTFNSQHGAFVENSTTNSFSYNNISNNTQYGLTNRFDNYTTILYNTVSGNGWDGIESVNASHLNVSFNRADYNGDDSIDLYVGEHNWVEGNTIMYPGRDGITVPNNTNTTVLFNNITDPVQIGVRCDWCYNVSILNNNITQATAAIGTAVMEDCRIENNILMSSSEGLYCIGNCNYNNFTNNTVGNHNYGVYLWKTTGNIFRENRVYGSTTAGIYIWNATQTGLHNNTVYDNPYGVYIRNTAPVPITYNMTNTLFLPPSGALENYTNLSIYDSVEASTTYIVNWSFYSGPLGPDHISFDQKFSNISTLAGTPSIDRVIWHWLDSEVSAGGYDDSRFELWKSNSSGSDMINGTPNTIENSLSQYNMNPASLYGILENTTVVGCVNLSDPSTYGTRIVNVSGNLYMNEDVDLCTDTYSINDSGNDGILLFNSSDIYLNCNNSILLGNSSGYAVYSDGFSHLQVFNCTMSGYYVANNFMNGLNITFTNNTINSDSGYGPGIPGACQFGSINSSLISNNTIFGNHSGILIHTSSSNNLIANNTFYGFSNVGGDAINVYADAGSNNTIEFNDFYDIGVGDINAVEIQASETILRNNSFTNTSNTISLQSFGQIIQNASIYSNVLNNSGTCLAINGENVSLSLIYNNYFNGSVYDDGTNNYWNTTYSCAGTNIIGGNCSGGNFYSDYTGVDTNGDGIGDLPPYYNITNSTGGQVTADYLPLTNNNVSCRDDDGDGANYSYSPGACAGQIEDCDDTDKYIVPPFDGLVLTDPNQVYTLCAGTYYVNVSNDQAILIDEYNITLDCNGTTIIGNGAGVLLEGYHSEMEVKNCIISNYSECMDFGWSDGAIIHDNTLSSCAYALSLENFIGGQAYENTILQSVYGISLYRANNSQLYNNSVESQLIGYSASNQYLNYSGEIFDNDDELTMFVPSDIFVTGGEPCWIYNDGDSLAACSAFDGTTNLSVILNDLSPFGFGANATIIMNEEFSNCSDADAWWDSEVGSHPPCYAACVLYTANGAGNNYTLVESCYNATVNVSGGLTYPPYVNYGSVNSYGIEVEKSDGNLFYNNIFNATYPAADDNNGSFSDYFSSLSPITLNGVDYLGDPPWYNYTMFLYSIDSGEVDWSEEIYKDSYIFTDDAVEGTSSFGMFVAYFPDDGRNETVYFDSTEMSWASCSDVENDLYNDLTPGDCKAFCGNILTANGEGQNYTFDDSCLNSTFNITAGFTYPPYLNYETYAVELNDWNTTQQAGPNIIGGLDIGGNFYSDYTGVDTNGDGIGETPYPIPEGGAIDQLPLTNQRGSQCVNLSDPSTYQGRVVNVSGTYYVNSNVTLCTDAYYTNTTLLQINASDIYLDCNGSSLIGDLGYVDVGINLTLVQNVDITNCTIRNFSSGAYFAGVSTSSLTYSDIYGNAIFPQFPSAGVSVLFSLNISITNNSIHDNNFFGAVVAMAPNTTVMDNSMANNSVTGIFLFATQAEHCENTILNNTAGYYGKPINYTHNMDGITFENINDEYSEIIWCGVNNSTIRNINMSDGVGGSEGTLLVYSMNNSIYGIHSQDNFLGMYLSNSHGNNISNSTFQNMSFVGPIVSESHFNRFSNLSVYSAGAYGISLEGASNNTFVSTEIANSDQGGIRITAHSENNSFLGTVLHGNAYVDGSAILMENDGPDYPGTNLFNNTLIYNSTNYLHFLGGPYNHSSNFTNLTICHNETVGCISWDFLNLTEANLVNGTNILLDQEFVSLNSSDVNSSQFNSSANITLYAGGCSGLEYYKKDGFPPGRSEIISTGYQVYPAFSSCSAGIATFSAVNAFSGYAINISGNCPVINSSGEYQMVFSFTGAPNSASPLIGNACVRIASSDVVFDCNGYTITNNGTAGTTHGIMVNGSFTNVTVKNCPSVSGYTRGITFYRAEDSIISNATAFNSSYGFFLINGDNNTVQNSTAYNMSDNGFYLYLTEENSTVKDSLAYNCLSGFVMGYSPSGNSFSNCTAHNNSYGFLLSFAASDNQVENSTSYDNDFYGFELNNATNNTLRNNTAHDNGAAGFMVTEQAHNNTFLLNNASFNSLHGFYVSINSTDNEFEHNNVHNNSDSGFRLYGDSDQNLFNNNTAYYNGEGGFYFNDSKRSRIYNNSAHHNTGTGFQLYPLSGYSLLVNNTAYNNTGRGFYIQMGGYTNFTNNMAYNNSQQGFFTQGSSYNIFRDNVAYNNILQGFYLNANSEHMLLVNNSAYSVINTVAGFRIRASLNATCTNNSAYDNLRGFRIENSHNCTLTGNIAYDNIEEGFRLDGGSTYNNLTNNTAYGNLIAGFMVYENATSYNLLAEAVAYQNGYGLFINSSNNTRVEDSLLYNNTNDLRVTNSFPNPLFLNLTNATFTNPSGSLLNYTSLDLHDSIETSVDYSLTWTTNSTSTPANMASFAQKFVNISTVAGTPSIDEVTWHWLDSELPGYNETAFELWKYNSSGWNMLNSSPDILQNSLSLYGMNPASDYGILQNNATPPGYVSLFAVPFNISDFTFASSVYDEYIVAEFNTTEPTTFFLLSSLNVEKLTSFGTNQIWTRIKVNGTVIDEERIRTVSGVGDVGSTALQPINFTLPAGNHNITVEFRRTGFGVISVYNIEFNLGKFLSNADNPVRYQVLPADYQHTAVGYEPAFNWTINKTVPSRTFLVAKGAHQSTASEWISYYFENLDNSDDSPTWERYLSSSSDVGSMLGVYISNCTCSANWTIQSKNYLAGRTTTVNMTIMDFDLMDNQSKEINSFFTTNASTNWSNPVLINSNWNKLANYTIELKNGTGLFLSFTATAQQPLPTTQVISYKVNVSNSPCEGFVDRSLTGTLDAGNMMIFKICDNLTAGQNYTAELWAKAAPGRTFNEYDESFVGFEIGEFPINVTQPEPGQCQVIDQPGTYGLTGNTVGAPISASPRPGTVCIKIASSDVIFNCNGYNITNNGTAGTTRAIILNGSLTNVTVLNCPGLSGYSYGLETFQSNESTFRNITAFNNSLYGLYVAASHYNLFQLSLFYNNTVSGGLSTSGTGNTYLNNSFFNNTNYGFYLQSSSNYNNFTNNSFHDNGLYGLHLFLVHNNSINNNAVFDNNAYGFYLIQSTHNNLSHNYAYGNNGHGFFLSTDAEYNRMFNNTAHSNTGLSSGFAIYNSSYNLFMNNTAYNNTQHGLFLQQSNYTNLTGNEAYLNAFDGFQLFIMSYFNNLTSNVAFNNSQNGIWLDMNCSNNTIQESRIYNNTMTGISVSQDSDNNSFSLNNVTGNPTGFILSADSDSTDLSGNYVCWNSLDISNSSPYSTGALDTCDSWSNWYENGHEGCTFKCTDIWHYFYGDINGSLLLAPNQADIFYSWLWNGDSGSIYVTRWNAGIEWDTLVALGRNSTQQNSTNDFTELDQVLGISSFPDNVNYTFSYDGSNPKNTVNISIFEHFVPYVPLANTSLFTLGNQFGVAWDSSQGTPQFNTSLNQDVIFGTGIDGAASYDYEIRVPANLATYKGGNTVEFWVELD